MSFEETMVKEAGIIGSMSNIEEMVKAYVSIIELRESVCLPASRLPQFLNRQSLQSLCLQGVQKFRHYIKLVFYITGCALSSLFTPIAW